MKRCGWTILLFVTLWGCVRVAECQTLLGSQKTPVPLAELQYVTARQAASSAPSMGMNLNGPADWNTELPFVDVFRLSRTWISQRRGAGWGQGPELELDEHGWVTRLEPGCFAETPLCTIDGGHYPAGRYTVLYEGTGQIEFGGSATVAEQTLGRMLIDVTPARGPIWLRLTATDPEDYVKRIRVILPGHEATFAQNPFRPGFLDLWRGMACLRFMDWQHTNHSKQQHWPDRPTLDSASWTVKGVPVEVMVDLCNRLKVDPWFCMPHLADDDYVRRFAAMVKERLHPERTIWVEYSNEIWNGMFSQNRWAGQQGVERGFADRDKPWEGAWRFCAWRSVQVFAIWEEVFGGTERLRRVLPTQAANAYVTERIVEFQDAYRSADAVAVAPYISLNLPPSGKGLTSGQVAAWTVDQVLDEVEQTRLPECIEWLRNQRRVAEKYGLKLVAYEGGQHFVGVAGGENNETLTKLLHAANAHPRMEGIYRRYFDAWQQEGGGLFCYFSSIGAWSKWGSWGILQNINQTAEQSPRYRAVTTTARRWQQAQGRR